MSEVSRTKSSMMTFYVTLFIREQHCYTLFRELALRQYFGETCDFFKKRVSTAWEQFRSYDNDIKRIRCKQQKNAQQMVSTIFSQIHGTIYCDICANYILQGQPGTCCYVYDSDKSVDFILNLTQYNVDILEKSIKEFNVIYNK